MRQVAVLIASLALVLAAAPTAATGEIVGKAKVIDGRTVSIGSQVIVLWGIWAPPADQVCVTDKGKPYPCGLVSARALEQLVSRGPLTCRPKGRTADGRVLAACFVDKEDIGRLMVMDGWARADSSQTLDYSRAEQAAKQLRSGLWKGATPAPN
jgi:endonuclease YncB( thermonuclease family)